MSWEIKTNGNDFEVIKKKCRRCKSEKPLSEYTIDRSMKDGLLALCRQCNSERRARKPKLIHRVGSKHCQRCGELKDYYQFCINKRKPDGYNHKCKDCDKIERDKRIDIDYAKLYYPI